jgi:hypothetical protein
MANESAVENVSELTTTAVCPGCGEEVNLLAEHLKVTVSPSRSVIQTVDAALVGAETDDQGNITKLAVDITQPGASRDMFYVATRSGAGVTGYFHSYTHLSDWANDQDDEVKIVPLDVDPQAGERGND